MRFIVQYLRAVAPFSTLLKSFSVALVLVLSACALHPVEEISPHFTERYATLVFSAGYVYISDRFIDDINIGNLTVSGLEGLTAIDPQLNVSRNGNYVDLSVDGSFLGSIPAPDDHDAKAWADLTVKIIKNGRIASKLLLESTAEDIYSSIFQSMVAELDGFSRYASATDARHSRANRDGFGGIGVQLLVDAGEVRVLSVIPDTPAEEMGLQDNDSITHIDDESVVRLTIGEVVNRLRGKINSNVNLTIKRDGSDDAMPVTLSRRLIVNTTVTHNMMNDLGYIRITSFNTRTSKSLKNILMEMETAIELGKIKGIVLDLRSNPGGLLDQAVEVADLFLTKGRIVSTNGRHPDSNQIFSADEDNKAQNLPVVVLINGNTASAAEIVAAALQDNGRAIVIGSNSYGKGTVQNVITLPNNSELNITWSRFHTPSGYTINNLGILPTICTSRKSIGAAGKENAKFIRLLKKFHAGVVISKAVFSQWRAKELPGKESIEKLRATCPARKKTSNQDLDVAKLLLSDPMNYSRAMNLSFPAVTNR